jgi:leucyl/phenylalanyl-tRNA--protein transferase
MVAPRRGDRADASLVARGFVLHDVQFMTPHLASLGASLIARAEYERRLAVAVRLPCVFAP